MKFKSLLLIPIIFLMAFKSDKPAYQLFTKEGKQIKYGKMIKAMKGADIIMFGELHNNPICHWLQLELTKDIYGQINNDLILGAEMFEADNQLILDEYLSHKIKESSFEKEARLWPNYKTDYKPLLNIAKENDLPFIATNIPRRYASVGNKGGFDEAKSYIAPLPVSYDPEVGVYKEMMEMMGDMGGHATNNLPKAQAIKDATMAHFILENFAQGKTFIHYHGAFHSKNFEGIVWYLLQDDPELNIITISSVEQDSLQELEEDNLGQADFIVVTPANMTKTY